ncbi:MAG: transposase [Candidatus Omnitrophica bacterium]|nr:transposase [Candidatus Omnitrophota bacterium]MCK5259741.1 transposase [Candidatus Omnitrophota bacterium]
MIHRFKSLTTARYRQMTKISQKLWQRSFYDHVIRNEKSLNRICKYVQGNPIRWKWNENIPENM